MRLDYTHITLVLDRSGSMASVRSDAEAGLNQFVELQKKDSGFTTLNLVQFDTDYETVYNGPIQLAPKFKLEPRGWTALNDSVDRAIDETGARLRDMPEKDRPGLVVLAILTDGEENSSTKLPGFPGKRHVASKLKHQEEKYSWKITYLGSNHDVFKEAGTLGINVDSTAPYTNVFAALSGLSGNVSRMKGATASGLMCASYYTKEEKTAMTS